MQIPDYRRYEGLIGRHLIPRLLTLGHGDGGAIPITRVRFSIPGDALWKGLAEREHLNEIDAIINLAGEPIADSAGRRNKKNEVVPKRWAITRKRSWWI